jgi:hypothetical protein
MGKTINEVIDSYIKKRVKLNIQIYGENVYLEGSTTTLKFLSEILGAYAEQDFQDNFYMSPKHAGFKYFPYDAKYGIGFWNTDYDEKLIEEKKKAKAAKKKASEAKKKPEAKKVTKSKKATGAK